MNQYQIRNNTLYKKIRKFVATSISELASFASKEPLPILPNVYSDEVQVDYFLFIFKHLEDLEKLPEFLNCAKYILKNPIIRKTTGWQDKEGNAIEDLPLKLTYFRNLYSILGSCIKVTNDFSFNQEIFEKIYKDFEKSAYSSSVIHEVTAPIEGIFGNFEEINFGEKIKLRPIKNEEKKSYVQQFSFPYPNSLPSIDIENVEYVLEGIHSQKKDSPTNTSSTQNQFADIISVLRLFKSGRIGFSFVKTRTLTWTTRFGVSYGWNHSRQGRISFKSYKITKTEKVELLKLWRKYKKFKKSMGSSDAGRYFNLALRWFNMGVEENDYENKMIDFFVSFEALCLPEKSELSYRLSNRIALLLGKDCEEKEKIRKFMIKAYKIRSKIVHGAKVSPINIDGEIIQLHDFTNKVEQYLREMLKIFLILSNKFGKQCKIIELIDKCLFDFKTMKKIQKLYMTS